LDKTSLIKKFIELEEKRDELQQGANCGYIESTLKRRGTWEQYKQLEAKADKILSELGLTRFYEDFGNDSTLSIFKEYLLPILEKE